MIKTVKEFNEGISIREVIEKLTGVTIEKNGGMICPIHGTSSNKKKVNASIKEDKNTFQCWTKNCTQGAVRSFTFADIYCREVLRMDNWKAIYKLLDSKFGTSLFKDIKGIKIDEPKKKYTFEVNVDKYCSEAEVDIFCNLIDDKICVLEAGTGVGKTNAIAKLFKNAIKDLAAIGIDKIIFTTPRSSIVEEISEEYDYSKFYKNDLELPSSSFVVATTHKARVLNEELDSKQRFTDGEIEDIPRKRYALIIDECHLLLTSRTIVGSMRELDKLIQNADLVLFTSANAEHFYSACKDLYSIKGYYHINRLNKIYNTNKFTVIRTNRDREEKRNQLIKIIKEEVKTNKVFLVYNNINELKEIEEQLNNSSILSKVVYSANKEDNNTVDVYNAIIKQSVLKCNVTLCTSVVDTGVNIKQKEGITTILVQSNLNIDDVTITQTFARVREAATKEIDNRAILILDSLKKREERHDIISKLENFKEYYNDLASNGCNSFNMHMLSNYDVESNSEYNLVWDLLKANDMYSPIESMMYVKTEEFNENPRMIVDTIAVYDKARRQHLSDNYYNDKFIKQLTTSVNYREIEFKEIVEEVEKKENLGVERFQDALISLMEDAQEFQDMLENRYLNVTEEQQEYFWLEAIKSEFSKKFNELDKRIFSMKGVLMKNRVNLDIIEYAKKMYKAYTLDKPRMTLEEVRIIEYPIYNTIFKQSDKDYTGIGDNLYEAIRGVFDLAARKGYKISAKAIQNTAEDFMFREGAVFIEGKWLNRKGKQIRITTKITEIKLTIDKIYNVSDKGYLSSLKVVG